MCVIGVLTIIVSIINLVPDASATSKIYSDHITPSQIILNSVGSENYEHSGPILLSMGIVGKLNEAMDGIDTSTVGCPTAVEGSIGTCDGYETSSTDTSGYGEDNTQSTFDIPPEEAAVVGGGITAAAVSAVIVIKVIGLGVGGISTSAATVIAPIKALGATIGSSVSSIGSTSGSALGSTLSSITKSSIGSFASSSGSAASSATGSSSTSTNAGTKASTDLDSVDTSTDDSQLSDNGDANGAKVSVRVEFSGGIEQV